MSNNYQVSQSFQDITIEDLPKGEYEDCTFKNCTFSEGNLSSYTFVECEFIDCDLSNVKLNDCAFREVAFKNCKMMGLQFDECNSFSLDFNFQYCVLDYATFYKLNIKKTRFINCRMIEVDFTETQLTESVFSDCDLSGSVFDRTHLEKADFRTAFNFNINPESNSIRKAKFSTNGLAGLLHKYNIIID